MKIKILDLFKRSNVFDKKIGIINNGKDNLYAEIIERATNNSVTAKTSSTIMSSYIIGKGFGDELDKKIIHPSKMLTLRKFGNILSRSISVQRGAFIHVMWNASFKIDRWSLIPYTHARLGKKDSTDYNGKVVVYDNWDSSEGKINKTKFNVIDVFNPKKEVIQAQVKSAGGWEKYKGQVLFVNLDDEYDYPLGTIDTVIEDCDSENQASIYKNRSLRKGYFGKTVMVTKPLAGSLEDYDSAEEWKKAQNERTDFKNTAESFVGAENNGGILHVELEHAEDKLEDAILIKQLDTDINDKMFEYTENSTFKNILMAFNNIPSGLVRSDNALFSNSGESLQVMKETYQESTTYERESLEETIKLLSKYYKENLGDINIIPLIEIKQKEEA